MRYSSYCLILVTGFLLTNCARKVNLAFSVPEKMDYNYRLTSTTLSQTQVMGMDMENNSEQVMEYNIFATGNDANGNKQLRTRYTAIQINQTAMGQEMVYDSKDPSRNTEPNLEAIYDAMINKSFDLTYGPDGKIIEAQGLNELMEDVLDKAPAEVQETLKSQLGGEVMLQSFKAMTGFYPGKPLKKGDAWPISNDLNLGGMALQVDVVYTLEESKNGVAKIRIDGEIATDPEAPGMDIMGMSMKFDLQGTQQGYMWVNEATGWAEKSELLQLMNGNMQMDSPQTGNMTIGMSITSNQQLERIK
ncbi:MAG: hypothetical protein DA408_04385 [Bacteroidetes bacterium]|nr:MAG: hypothetical protein C7N36_12255 [Bacteroidota bacterium]PTM14136.1 MAG: hypothetical protein DA408_04385 [Bacteroidota bacterium]